MNKKILKIKDKSYIYHDITDLSGLRIKDPSRLPYSLKILLEGALRNYDDRLVTDKHIKAIASWDENRGRNSKEEIPFIPARVVLQDFTGVPLVVDLATMRDKMQQMGGGPAKINSELPVDLVIDHSVNVDFYGSDTALDQNVQKEFERNKERYELLKWAQEAFSNFRVFPPSLGIVHQINLEYLASVATVRSVDGQDLIYPDSLVGTDSHTPMINGIGVLGWGVGGIEAEASMLGQPMYFLMPELVGFKLTGSLPKEATATDLVLTITNILRKQGVVGKFVEFYGDGLDSISVEDRATVSNMCPEYGATSAYFPVDDKTLDYLRRTGRSEDQIVLVREYFMAQGMFRTAETQEPSFTSRMELDLSNVRPSLAGPKRPQDLISLEDMKKAYERTITSPSSDGGYGLNQEEAQRAVSIDYKDGSRDQLQTGAVVIAAITSCTNTSNPYVMIGAGLLAKKAVKLGLTKPSYVKSSFAPGSLVVTEYLEKAGLLPYLAQLGFNVVGYGCTTCIGNSGPLDPQISQAIIENDMTLAAVLSGNRNFEGRIHQLTKMNYLASPPLVVAYGLAGTVNIDLYNEPIGYGRDERPVFLKDIWPDRDEIMEMIERYIDPSMYRKTYKDILTANDLWNELKVDEGKVFKWNEDSDYVRMPTFFDGMGLEAENPQDISGANILALLGDTVTTDHISPAGSIPETSDAGSYLKSQNIETDHYNSYGSRRGSHEVMMRGTFANIRIRNRMVPGVEGGFTKHIPSDEVMSIYKAGMKYRETNTPLVVVAGKEYGTGSSRDWAAKGTFLLGVKAVLAKSFERIHRSNLIGMGILPLEFTRGQDANSIGLVGNESFDISGVSGGLYPDKVLNVSVTRPDKTSFSFEVIARLDNDIEVEYFAHGGILQMLLRSFLSEDQ
ncbi:MAG TPA: aconitate hydratase AcnA [Bacillota bacterium]|nr:aconitate hydratase AcnA [Bacillota bacterium]